MKQWPKKERPCERLQSLGAGQLSDGELLAILLNTGDTKQGLSALELSRTLLQQGGNLVGVEQMGFEEICALRGIGLVKCCRIKAAFEIANRLSELDDAEQPKIDSSEAIVSLMHRALERQRREHFVVLLLNARHRLLCKQTIAIGSTNGVHVHPREVFHLAVREQASALAVVHNHPSGDPRPSEEDKKLTVKLTCIGELLGIPLIDHIIVCSRHRYYSFADRFKT